MKKSYKVGQRVRVKTSTSATLIGVVVSKRVYRYLPIDGQEPVRWAGYLVFIALTDAPYNYKLAGMTKENEPEFRRFVNLDIGVSVLFVHEGNLEVVS